MTGKSIFHTVPTWFHMVCKVVCKSLKTLVHMVGPHGSHMVHMVIYKLLKKLEMPCPHGCCDAPPHTPPRVRARGARIARVGIGGFSGEVAGAFARCGLLVRSVALSSQTVAVGGV